MQSEKRLWTNDGPDGQTSLDLVLHWFAKHGQIYVQMNKQEQLNSLRALTSQLPQSYALGRIPLRTVETVQRKLSVLLHNYKSVCDELSCQPRSLEEERELKQKKCPYFDKLSCIHSSLKRSLHEIEVDKVEEVDKIESVKKLKLILPRDDLQSNPWENVVHGKKSDHILLMEWMFSNLGVFVQQENPMKQVEMIAHLSKNVLSRDRGFGSIIFYLKSLVRTFDYLKRQSQRDPQLVASWKHYTNMEQIFAHLESEYPHLNNPLGQIMTQFFSNPNMMDSISTLLCDKVKGKTIPPPPPLERDSHSENYTAMQVDSPSPMKFNDMDDSTRQLLLSKQAVSVGSDGRYHCILYPTHCNREEHFNSSQNLRKHYNQVHRVDRARLYHSRVLNSADKLHTENQLMESQKEKIISSFALKETSNITPQTFYPQSSHPLIQPETEKSKPVNLNPNQKSKFGLIPSWMNKK